MDGPDLFSCFLIRTVKQMKRARSKLLFHSNDLEVLMPPHRKGSGTSERIYTTGGTLSQKGYTFTFLDAVCVNASVCVCMCVQSSHLGEGTLIIAAVTRASSMK